MKNLNAVACVMLAAVVVGGCGAAEEGTVGGGADGDGAPVNAEAEVARIEFEDGNVVRFEELYGGVLMSEVGSELNARHLVPKQGLTALEAFKSLAPTRTVPAALMRLHERMHPPGATLRSSEGTAVDATPRTDETAGDPDLEHGGEFQQSNPAANFLATMCNFPLVSPSYKHSNRTDAHTDVSLKIHSAYYAAGADIGIMTEQACAGKSDSRGFFSGQCNAVTAVQPGFVVSSLYDAGLSCSTACEFLGTGCVSVCTPRQVRWDLRHGQISSSVRFHECASLAH